MEGDRMKRLEAESIEGRREWEEDVLRRWALKRAVENGSKLARDIGVSQPTMSRFVASGGRMSAHFQKGVRAYWQKTGIDVHTAEAELLKSFVEDATEDPDAEDPFPSTGESGDEAETDAQAGVETTPDVGEETDGESGEGLHADNTAGVVTGTAAPEDEAGTDTEDTDDAAKPVPPTGEDGGVHVEQDDVAQGEDVAGQPPLLPDEQRDEPATDATRHAPAAESGDVHSGTEMQDDDASDADAGMPAAVPAPDNRVTVPAGASFDATETARTEQVPDPTGDDAPVPNDAVPGNVNGGEHGVDVGVAREDEAASEHDHDDVSLQKDSQQVEEGEARVGEAGVESIDTNELSGATEGDVSADGEKSIDEDEWDGTEERGSAVDNDTIGDKDSTGDKVEPPSFIEEMSPDISPQELDVNVPILALMSPDAARAGRAALQRGWRRFQDPPPEGMHGDALFYLRTKEEIAFEDEGAMRAALAPDRHEFACGLTASEMRFGVHPRRRQKRHAVAGHKDRTLLIGERLAAVIPEVPYEGRGLVLRLGGHHEA